jgi:lysyl-tRNA synthetase class 2
MKDAVKKQGVDVDALTDEQLFKELAKRRIECKGEQTRGNAIAALFDAVSQPLLIQPVHIIDHPKETSPLCKQHRKDPALIERFESFAAGMELSNAYSELNDPVIQRELLEDQARQLRAGDAEANPMDEDFVRAIEHGMPPAGGLGFGVDRMIMLLTNQQSIRDVIAFPAMKPE